MSDQHTDLDSHHIEGYVPNQGHISIPLITEVVENLWQGGCVNGVRLPDDFGFVLSLYPWEKYALGANTERREERLYDGPDVPDPRQLLELASLVNEKRKHVKTLVHCQAGLNRSGLLTGLALVLGGMAPVDAIELMRRQRSPLVLCNGAFSQWLLNRPAQEQAA